MSETIVGSCYVVYLCSNCDQWHGLYIGPLDGDAEMAEAARIVANALREVGDAQEAGLLVVRPDPDRGELVTLFPDGALVRATKADTNFGPQLEQAFGPMGTYGMALQHLAHEGRQTSYTDADWPRILTDQLRPETQDPEPAIMSAEDLNELWGR